MLRHILSLTLLVTIASISFAEEEAPRGGPAEEISFHRDVRPLFQAHCQGCHQPSKRGGEYVMTSFEQLLQPGESAEPAIVPGDPDASYLIDQITPTDGEALMPKGKEPLSEEEIALIRTWIAQGAKDDTPENARVPYDMEHPPVYTRPPVVTSLDFSPDGSLLAIAGFHEVLLRSADGERLLARLVGLSERIEGVAFSPDGKRLAVAGGQPGQMGELQIWKLDPDEEGSAVNVTLERSIPVTHDTVYGASWSPDGSLVAVGCGDATVRGFDLESGEQVFFNGAHDDWALETIFSADGSHIVSVGRDMSTKLYNVETQRFIDNVTSITPGALKGGLSALARHPELDVILVGGSDGVPRIYRMHRVTKRVIGDDANLLRQLPGMTGRIYGVAFSPDGKRMVCASSLDGQGQVFTYRAEFEFEMPDEIKKIVETRVQQQNAEQKKQLEEYIHSGVELLTQTEVPGGVFAVTYHPSGESIAAAGADGTIRIIDPADGTVTREFPPIDVASEAELEDRSEIVSSGAALDRKPEEPEAVPSGRTVTTIEVTPSAIELHGQHDSAQLLVTGILDTGDRIDLTRMAELSVEQGEAVELSPLGRVLAAADGEGRLRVRFGDHTAEVPVAVSGVGTADSLSFIRDVNPVLSRLGCNAGTCHGAQDGQKGFKLSLRGYDPLFDTRSFTDDLKSRRTNVASPDDSLMLLKATSAVPHMGGQLTQPGEPYYEIIRQWIAEGARLDLDVERVTSITIEPQNPIVQELGARQQVRVVATYSNGRTRDVTREAFIESGNTEVAEADEFGVVTAIRRGEAPILARFEGSYAATTLTAMGDRGEFVWEEPEVWGEVDRLVAEKWQRMKILPSELCSDADFIRRIHLDLTGLPPSPEQVREFLADSRPTREKRDEVIDQLIGSDAYVDYWTNKWADLLQVNSKFLGKEGAQSYRNWIRNHIAENTPYDTFCQELLTATGSNKEHPASSYFKILRDPDEIMENTTHLFLGVRFNCNKCHDHPFERWTQDQYYETAAFFARTGLKRDPENKEGNIGGTAVEGAKPLWEVVYDRDDGEITHDRTGVVTAPQVPYNRDLAPEEELTRREQLARWIVHSENEYFAKSYVNRVWGYLLGVGLIEPLDDIRAGNPPTNPELLEYLTREFIDSGFDVRQLMQTIVTSRTYQLSVASNEWNEDDERNYARALPKRLPAEVLYDAVHTVTGAKMNIPGVPEGTRAAALPDAALGPQDGFLATLGRPVRESACECERSSELQLGSVMALMNSSTISDAISQPGNALEQLVADQPDDQAMVNEMFLRILNRPAREAEIEAALEILAGLEQEQRKLVAELKDYEREIAPVLAKREEQRQALIKTAREDLEAFEEEIRPAQEAAEQARQEKIAAARQAVEQHLATATDRLREWEQTAIESQTPWTALDFHELNSNTGAKLEKEEEGVVFVSGPNNQKGNYTLAAKTDLENVTAIKLELLTDDRLPNRGPGRARNGNFVLTELTVQAWPQGKPGEKKQLTLKNAQADFSQDNYDVATAIDGQTPPTNNGWASSPRTGENRVATFEFEQPLRFEEGTVLHFALVQRYQDNQHTIGKFRISVTTAGPPVDFGHPESILEVIQTDAEERSEEQQQALLDYFNQRDEKLQELKKQLANAEQPLPVDPKLVELREILADREQPLPEDPKLGRLKRAVELSEQQLENGRLTLAQDLAWALVNSPAFLFNR
jgi:WD40 repeat protein